MTTFNHQLSLLTFTLVSPLQVQPSIMMSDTEVNSYAQKIELFILFQIETDHSINFVPDIQNPHIGENRLARENRASLVHAVPLYDQKVERFAVVLLSNRDLLHLLLPDMTTTYLS